MAVVEGEQGIINGWEESIRVGRSMIEELRGQEAYYRGRVDELRKLEEEAEEKLGGILAQINAIEKYIGLIEPENGLGGNGKVNGVPKLESPQETH